MQQRASTTIRAIVREAESQLADILSRIPFVEAKRARHKEAVLLGFDFIVDVSKGKKTLGLAVEVKSNAQLRDAKLAIERLQALRLKSSIYPVFCSQYLSPSIRRACEESELSFFDFVGNYRFVFGDVFIEREAGDAKPLEKKRLRSFFAPKAARVLRRLFNEPQRAWKVMGLAEESGVSPATVSLLKDKLVGENYAMERPDGLVLYRPGRLLKAWSTQYRYNDNRQMQFYSAASRDELESHFAKYCEQNHIDYGFTLFSAADRVAPFVRGVTVSHAYVPSSDIAMQISRTLQLKPVDSGGNFCLLIPSDEDLLFGRYKMENVFVVSDMQLYLDLVSHPTRGEENAEFLLEHRLETKW